MAGDTFTGFLHLIKPEIGGSRDAWGQKFHQDMDKIDVWAKGVDTLAKDAVYKSIQKDAQGNTVKQVVAGPVDFSAAVNLNDVASVGKLLTAKEGVVVSEGKSFTAGEGFFRETPGKTHLEIVTGSANNFRIVNVAYTQELFKVDPASILYKGGAMWHSGNLTPGNYYDKTSTAQQLGYGDHKIVKANAQLILEYGGVYAWGIMSASNSELQLRDTNGGETKFAVRTNGSLWSSQMGDINDRIESRAKSWADDRIANYDVQVAGSYANKNSTDPQNFAGAGQFAPYLDIVRGNVVRMRMEVEANGTFSFKDGDRNDGWLSFWSDGNIWSKLWNNTVDGRIEQRAREFADDRLASATNRINNKTIRYTYAGDLDNHWNLNGGNYAEPFNGAFMTTRNTTSDGYALQWSGSRWRYIQMSDSNGTWYHITYS